MGDFVVPFDYEPRPYQLPILEALDSGITRAMDASVNSSAGPDNIDIVSQEGKLNSSPIQPYSNKNLH